MTLKWFSFETGCLKNNDVKKIPAKTFVGD